MTTNEIGKEPTGEEVAAVVKFSEDGMNTLLDIREKYGWSITMASVSMLFTKASSVFLREKTNGGMTKSAVRKKLHEMMGKFEGDIIRNMKSLDERDKKAKDIPVSG